MNNRGFTLVELLGVLVLIALISALIFPIVKNIIDKSKEVTHQTQINRMLSASYDYTLKNTSYLPGLNESKYLTLSILKKEGLVDSNIINPDTNRLFQDNLVISIKNVGANYQYTNPNSKLMGEYLYTVEEEKINEKRNLPVISLTGLIRNASGDYVVLKDINSVYQDYEYTASSNMGISDLTNKVVYNIYHENKIVDSIDTSKQDLYKVVYTVVDSQGNSSITTLSVIIGDNTPPTIEIPGNATISSTRTTFDLMEGVTCADNSEICDITYVDTITYGIPGKYIITYTASDPSGNTSSKKRVITIE